MTVTNVDSRTTITRPGTYTLSADIEGGDGTPLSEACIRIESSDVVLDGAGHSVDGNGVSDTTGIAVASSTRLENVVVRNVTLSDWDCGVLLRNVTGGSLRGVNVVGNGYGVSLEDTYGVVLHESEVTGNLLGVCMDPACDDTDLRDNDIESNRGRDVLRQSCLPTPTGLGQSNGPA